MIKFDDRRLGLDEVVDKEKWNGLIDDAVSFFNTEGNIDLKELKLSLSEGTDNTKLTLFDDGESSVYSMGVRSSEFVFNLGHPGARYAFHDNDAGTRKEIFTIKGNGNVGIGDSSPDYKLSLGSNESETKLKLANGNNNTFYGIGARTSRFIFTIPGHQSRYAFYNQSGSTQSRKEIFTIKGNGHVGINHTNPSVPLEVKGRIFGDNVGALDFMDTPQIKTKKVQSHNSNILKINPEGNQVQIGRNREELALDIKGHVKVLGVTPIRIIRISDLKEHTNNPVKINNVHINSNEFNACVVGFNCSDPNARVTRVQILNINGKFHVGVSSTNNSASFTVDVMVTRFGMSFAIGI